MKCIKRIFPSIKKGNFRCDKNTKKIFHGKSIEIFNVVRILIECFELVFGIFNVINIEKICEENNRIIKVILIKY